ncbi:hypothetical protein GGH94_001529 [Coemansia aciculifera]|uniref:Uncharacterized protein n=1 Tax=Coemansia aciculifera TaxID=417176 RepID=A0A9W8IMQ6_9FUNG|nr:hypothetical protein GGH94_001529 [Coemansia aciculifera]
MREIEMPRLRKPLNTDGSKPSYRLPHALNSSLDVMYLFDQTCRTKKANVVTMPYADAISGKSYSVEQLLIIVTIPVVTPVNRISLTLFLIVDAHVVVIVLTLALAFIVDGHVVIVAVIRIVCIYWTTNDHISNAIEQQQCNRTPLSVNGSHSLKAVQVS